MKSPEPLILRQFAKPELDLRALAFAISHHWKVDELNFGSLVNHTLQTGDKLSGASSGKFTVHVAETSWHFSPEVVNTYTGGELIFLRREDSNGSPLSAQMMFYDVLIFESNEPYVIAEVTSGIRSWFELVVK